MAMAARELAQGRHSKVEIIELQDRLVAIKTFQSNPVDASREIGIHRTLSERVPGVVGLIEEREDPKCLVLEYCSLGSLRMFYAQLPELLPELSLLEYFRGMILVVEAIHNLRYVHRALTAENWLVTEDRQIKLSDFGHTIFIPPTKSLNPYSLGHDSGEYTSMIFVNDVTILGNVFLQMATGNFELRREVITPEVFEQCYSTSRYSYKVKSLVKSLLFYDNGGIQVEVRKGLMEIFEEAVLEKLEDVSLVYPGGASPCTSCTKLRDNVVRLPCNHYLCANCRSSPGRMGEVHCDFCSMSDDFGISFADLMNLFPEEGKIESKTRETKGEIIHKSATSTTFRRDSGRSIEIIKEFNTEESIAEINAHTQLSDLPNVIQVLRSSFQPPRELVMEYCEHGPLPEYMKRRGSYFTEEELLRHCYSMMKTVREVHKRGFIHRMLIAKNWLVTSDGQIKLSNFGYAKRLSTDMRPEGMFVQDARMLGLVILQLATLDFTTFAIKPEIIEQRLAESPYTDTVKDIIRALLLNERGENQFGAMRHLYNLYEFEKLDDPEDALMYPLDKECCCNYPCPNPPQKRLPCTHSFCLKCMQRYTHFNSVTCRICNKNFPEDSSTTISHSTEIVESSKFILKF